MILTSQEYRDMGFSAGDDSVLESCLKRADYILNGLTGGKAGITAASGGKAAEFVKQAAAFQTQELVSMESRDVSSDTGEDRSEKVTVGDFSYSTTSSSQNSTTTATVEPFETQPVVVSLLRSAGCLFGGLEVRE